MLCAESSRFRRFPHFQLAVQYRYPNLNEQALQRLLTRSLDGKLLAVKRVTENAGKKTAGVDGKIWTTPASKLKAVRLLTHRGYQPLPLRRV